jgi:hypothetical protein
MDPAVQPRDDSLSRKPAKQDSWVYSNPYIFLNTSVPLVPPNPKELDMAIFKGIFRAVLGT